MLKGSRILILAATPMEHSELRTIFSDQPESIRRRLEHPPRLRDAGWDLPSMAQAEFLRGELIRVVERDRMVVDLYRDGAVVLGGKIDRNCLAWSDKDDQRLHPLALIELTVNFTRFYRCVLDDLRTAPNRIKFRIELKNMHLGNQGTELRSGPVHQYRWIVGAPAKEAPADTWGKDFVVATESYNPDRVAFLLIHELYLWFGHSEEAIPYTKETEGEKAVDADQIANIR